MLKFLAAIVVALSASVASANIVYNVNRSIGAGSVVGTIETDGTLGTLSSANIVDWTFTLTSASLTLGSPSVITMAGGGLTFEVGGLFSATAFDLTFDFSGAPGGFMLFQGSGGGNYWCLQTNGCFNFDGAMEAIGFGPNGSFGIEAETAAYSTAQVVASVGNAIPEPGMLCLLGLGLLGLGASRRKRA